MQALGRNNIQTLDTENNLASVYCKMGEWEEAKKKYARVEAGYMEAKGADSADYAMSKSNVGECLVKLGKVEEGLAKLEKVRVCEFQRTCHKVLSALTRRFSGHRPWSYSMESTPTKIRSRC